MPPKQKQQPSLASQRGQQQQLSFVHTEHQLAVLQQIKKIGPKTFYYFQYDLFGVIMSVSLVILGLLPCIGFATISYEKQSGGTNPDSNEDLRVLMFVAPTVFLFCVAIALYRLTNQRYPWTEVTFDFLEGAVIYRTSTGLKFLISSCVNLCCCGCFCFAADENAEDFAASGSLNSEIYSYGKKRAMFSEIKEIGVGKRFEAKASHEETEFVVGLKIKRRRHKKGAAAISSSSSSAPKILVGEQRNKANADYYLDDGDDEKKNEEEEEEQATEEEQELIVSSSKPNSKSNLNSDLVEDEKETHLLSPQKDENEEEEQKQEEPSSDDEEDEDDEKSNNYEEFLELVPLDVVSSKENVNHTIKFWKRWMRRHYDSVNNNSNAENQQPQQENETKPQKMRQQLKELPPLAPSSLKRSNNQKENVEKEQEVESPSQKNPLDL